MKKHLKTAMSIFLSLALVLGSFYLPTGTGSKLSKAASYTKQATGVNDDGNIIVGVKGTYIRETLQAGIDRINQIRKEAYDEGLVKAYVPIRLSLELTIIAEQRAAEAAIREDHTRPNGKDCFSFSYDGVQSYAEDLAWNSGLVGGINNWYEEKSGYINGTPGAITGHYTSMINPSYTFVGLSCFRATGTEYPDTVVGEFSSLSDEQTDITDSNLSNETMIRSVEVLPHYITYTEETTELKYEGESKELYVEADFECEGSSATVGIYDLDWTSSNPSVASVSDNTLNFVSKGTADITTYFYDRPITIHVKVLEKIPSDAELKKLFPPAKITSVSKKTKNKKKYTISFKSSGKADAYQAEMVKKGKKYTWTINSKKITVTKAKKANTYRFRAIRYKTYDTGLTSQKRVVIYGAWSKKVKV